MGHALAPYIFQRFAEAVLDEVSLALNVDGIAYLADWLLHSASESDLRTAVEMIESMGISTPINRKRPEGQQRFCVCPQHTYSTNNVNKVRCNAILCQLSQKVATVAMKGAEEKAVEINVGSRHLSVALNWTSRRRGSRLIERRSDSYQC